MSDRTRFDYKYLGTGFLGVVALAVLSFVGVLICAVHDPRQFAFSYLFAFTFFFTICIGALFWVLLHHAVHAEWSVVVRRQLENLSALLLTLAVLFVPLLFVAPWLWTWMQPDAHHPLLAEKAAYLNGPFFWFRASFYFCFFVTVAYLLRGFSIAQDQNGSPRYTLLSRRLTFASLIPFGLCVTFAAIDWLMGLDYRWSSSIWGVYLFAEAILSALCVLVLIVSALRRAGYFQGMITAEHYQILGKLLLAFTIFWAYIAFSQYLLIWYANIPEETVYFLRRTTGSWDTLSICLIIGHFFVPFLLLLPGLGKRQPAFLCGVAVWILLMHLLDCYLIVLPALYPDGAQASWLDLFSFLAIGFTLTAVFLKQLGDSALYPLRDPRLPQSLALKN